MKVKVHVGVKVNAEIEVKLVAKNRKMNVELGVKVDLAGNYVKVE